MATKQSETALQRYDRLFAEWIKARDKADILRRAWEEAAEQVRAENKEK